MGLVNFSEIFQPRLVSELSFYRHLEIVWLDRQERGEEFAVG